MKNMTLANIAKACHGTYIGKETELQKEIQGAVTDSRQVEEGYLFIPIKGARVDGHDFILQVMEKGAAVALSEKKLEHCEKPYILVESSEQALKDIAEFYREQLTIPVVGITGSVGKTSTKEMIASVLSQKYNVLKTAGNFNNEIGLPLTLLRIREEHEAAVVEMGISDFGEMHRLAKMAKPDICVMTNIGICHLENLKTRDGILKAKSEIFDFIRPDGHVVLNGDDDKLVTLQKIKSFSSTVADKTAHPDTVENDGDITPLFYGILEKKENLKYSENSDIPENSENMYNNQKTPQIYADNIVNCGLKGVEADLHTPEGEISVHIPIPGQHNIYNAMAALGVGMSLGMSLEEIKQGIEKTETIGGRSNLIETGGLLVIDDCYNANPVSMRASLDVLSNGLERTIAVLGDMGELGEQEKQLHYEVGAYAAEKQIDVLFCAGTLSKEMAQGARDAGKQCDVHYFETREEMIPKLLEYLQKGDTVLVKASHFMEYPKVVEALKEYSCAVK